MNIGWARLIRQQLRLAAKTAAQVVLGIATEWIHCTIEFLEFAASPERRLLARSVLVVFRASIVITLHICSTIVAGGLCLIIVAQRAKALILVTDVSGLMQIPRRQRVQNQTWMEKNKQFKKHNDR